LVRLASQRPVFAMRAREMPRLCLCLVVVCLSPGLGLAAQAGAAAVPVEDKATPPAVTPVKEAIAAPVSEQIAPAAPAPYATPAPPTAPEDKPALPPERLPLPPVAPVQETRPAADGGSVLNWIELSVGGLPLRVNAGGVMALHPNAPFRVVGTLLCLAGYRPQGLSGRPARNGLEPRPHSGRTFG
jgi:hypothetical protein